MGVKEGRVLWVAEWSQKLRGSKKHPDSCLTSVTLMRSQSALLSTFSHLARQSAGKWLSAWKSLRSCPQPPGFLLATSVPSSDSFLVTLLLFSQPCDVRGLTDQSDSSFPDTCPDGAVECYYDPAPW